MDHDWLDNSVEAYVDGELSAPDRVRFEAALAESSELRASAAAARRIRDELAALELPACPDTAVSEVLALAAATRSESAVRSRYFDALLAPRMRWGRALAAAGAVAGVVLISVLVLRSPDQPSAVDRGLADVKLALAYVGEAGRHAGDIVRVEVVDESVILPIRRAVSHVTGEQVERTPRTDSGAAPSKDNKHDQNDE